jgi:hypothetical protein
VLHLVVIFMVQSFYPLIDLRKLPLPFKGRVGVGMGIIEARLVRGRGSGLSCCGLEQAGAPL